MDWFHQIIEFLKPDNISIFLNEHVMMAYLVILVWTFFEGETIVIIAGAAAVDWSPNPVGIILAAVIGSMCGDNLAFLIGRYKGKGIIAKRPFWQAKAQKVYDLLHRHHTWLLMGFRFLYGLRNITPFAIGMTEIPARRFFVLNFCGAVLWANAFTWGGFFLGRVFTGLFEHHKFTALAGLCALILSIWLVRTVIRRRKAQRMKREGAAGEATMAGEAPAGPGAPGDPVQKEV